MITAEVYEDIACLLEQASSLHLDVGTELTNMQNALTDTLTTDMRRALLREEIEQLRVKIVEEQSRPLAPLVESVRLLQLHVVNHYGSVNAFLSDNNIEVSPYFAAQSALAGYSIDAGNIGSSCL